MSAPRALRGAPNPRQGLIAVLLLLGCRLQEASLRLAIPKLVWELTDVVPNLLNVFELLLPLCHTVSGLFILQASQDCLVFDCYFHQFFLSVFSVERCLFDAIWSGCQSWMSAYLGCRGRVYGSA